MAERSLSGRQSAGRKMNQDERAAEMDASPV